MRFFAIIVVICLLSACSGSTDVTPGKKVEDSQKDAVYQKEMDELRKARALTAGRSRARTRRKC
jgi:outer membrane biogenesis lipoprotein LolB